MRTTVNVDEQVLAEAKQVAARTVRSLSALVEDALRQALARRKAPTHGRPTVPVFGGDGLQAGVDLDDTAALLDLLDEGSAAP